MRMEVHLQQRMEQRMHLSQQMLQNLELLQLPLMELRDLIIEELQENPTLEEKQDVDESEPSTPADPPEESAEDVQRREMLESVEEQWADSERRTRRTDSAEDAERRMEMLNNLCSESTSLREHLQSQLAILEVDKETRAICDHVIQNVGDDGYLRVPIHDVASSLQAEFKDEPTEVLVRKVEHALTIIQSMEPRGVGARSIKECLILQLDAANAWTPLIQKMIENHFEDIGANRLPKIARALATDAEAMDFLGITGEPDTLVVLEQVKRLIEEISKLNPKPGATYSSDKVPKVYPEVMIKQVDGKYEIVLEDGWLPPISVSRKYEDMMRERKLAPEERARIQAMARAERFAKDERIFLAEFGRSKRITPVDRTKLEELLKRDDLTVEERSLFTELSRDRRLSREEREFIKRKMDAGRKLITAIEQRRGTIYRITNELLRRQKPFFENGIEHMKPLKMQEVADALGIHLSTVSRAISDKWVETPRGIFPLKFFFASAAPRSETPPGAFGSFPAPSGNGQEDRTRLALMERIRELIDVEDKKKPYSDLEIVRMLKDKHAITAARRTIAKYREEMNIPSSRLRKQY